MRAPLLLVPALLVALAAASPALAFDVAEVLLLDAPLESRRFAEGATPGAEFKAGQRVTVLADEGRRVRIYVGDSYGWVSSEALAAAASDVPVIPLSPVE